MPSKSKRDTITFYPSPELLAWYKALPMYKRSGEIVRLLTEATEEEAKRPSLEARVAALEGEIRLMKVTW